MTAIDGHSLWIYARILLSLLPLSVEMTVPPMARRSAWSSWSAPEGGDGQAPGRVLDWEGFRELWEQLHPADGIEEVGEEVRFGRNIASETEAPILSVNLVWSGCAVV